MSGLYERGDHPLHATGILVIAVLVATAFVGCAVYVFVWSRKRSWGLFRRPPQARDDDLEAQQDMQEIPDTPATFLPRPLSTGRLITPTGPSAWNGPAADVAPPPAAVPAPERAEKRQSRRWSIASVKAPRRGHESWRFGKGVPGPSTRPWRG
ncbi:hypothetical protein AURDEDRAFT_112015 [Auricularia subglabra TFB-10046 SS5]|nr:hypothetical protein AURDEDRAFT_112015 [Auricularia subglabra TFB-10046 SS5]